MKKSFVCSAMLFCAIPMIILGAGNCLADGPDKVRIGATSPLTGSAAEPGIASKEGFMLAVKEVNAEGGVFLKKYGKKVPISLIVEDCQSKPEVGVALGEKMITKDKVHILIGDAFHSHVTMAVMELAPKYGIPIYSNQPISTAIAKKVEADPDRYWSFWKGAFNSDAMGNSVYYTYKYLLEKGKIKAKTKTIAFIIEDTDWGRGNTNVVRDLFKKDGWKSLTIEAVSLGNTDFYPQLSKIQALNPDILITSLTNLSSGVALTKQFHEIGLSCSLFAIYFPVRPEFIMQAGKSAESLLFNPLTFVPTLIKKQAEFVERFKKSFGKTPNMDHALAYDSLYNLVDSLKRAGTVEPKPLVKAISELDHMGLMGRYVFNKANHSICDGETYVPVTSAQIQNGQRKIIWPSTLATTEYETPSWLK